jgi:hypothetical protein
MDDLQINLLIGLRQVELERRDALSKLPPRWARY